MYLLFIIVLFLFIYQSHRISKIEELVKGNVVKPTVTPEVVHTPSTVPNAVKQEVPVKQDISTEEASGRIIGRIGIAAVVIGMAFFLKYAFDNDWVGPAGRVMIGLLIGLFVMGIGQFVRAKYLQYSDLLMGGGLAILYLSVFSSFAMYHLVDPMIAFFGMIVITLIGVAMSIMNATMTLSVIAFIGGFMAPILIGVTNLGEFVTFSYITILNVGILGILLYKKWANLVLCGLLGTWLIFGTWMATHYTQEMLLPTLIFVLIQFVIFTTSSVFRIIVEKVKATELDYFVLSTTALAFAITCYELLMPEYKHYASIGSVLVAGMYIMIALVAYKENPEDRTINIFLPGLAVSFLTVAVPIEFSGPWIAAWWFVESLVLYVLASSSSSRGFQVMGVVVYILGLLNLFNYLINFNRGADFVVIFNGPFIMTIMAVLVAYAIAFIYHRYGSTSTEIQDRGISVFIVLANILTVYAFTTQIITYYELQGVNTMDLVNMGNMSVSIFWALYAGILTVIGFAKRLSPARYMGLTLFIITAFKVVVDVWSLGQIYRIVSFIVFGVIALITSYIYVRYRERLGGK